MSTFFAMTFAVSIALLALLLLVGVGARVRNTQHEEVDATRWGRFLLGATAFLLVIMAIGTLLYRPAPAVMVPLLPILCGAVTALFLHLFAGGVGWNRRTLRQFLGALGLCVGLWLIFNVPVLARSDLASLLGLVIVISALVALGWHLGQWLPFSYPMILVFLLISLWTTDVGGAPFAGPRWLVFIIYATAFLTPTVAIAFAARLIQRGQVDGRPVDWRKVFLGGVLALPILSLVGAQLWLAAVWEAAADGFGIFLGFFTGIATIAAAIQWAWSVTGRRKLAALAFVLVVLLNIIGAFWMLQLGPSRTHMTEQRAAVINGALQRYHAQHGVYPPALSHLTPWYLLYIRKPLFFRGQTWCYAGGKGYYRLGYLYRQNMHFPLPPPEVRIHAAVGELPPAEWACKGEVAKPQPVAPVSPILPGD